MVARVSLQDVQDEIDLAPVRIKDGRQYHRHADVLAQSEDLAVVIAGLRVPFAFLLPERVQGDYSIAAPVGALELVRDRVDRDVDGYALHELGVSGLVRDVPYRKVVADQNNIADVVFEVEVADESLELAQVVHPRSLEPLHAGPVDSQVLLDCGEIRRGMRAHVLVVVYSFLLDDNRHHVLAGVGLAVLLVVAIPFVLLDEHEAGSSENQSNGEEDEEHPLQDLPIINVGKNHAEDDREQDKNLYYDYEEERGHRQDGLWHNYNLIFFSK